MAYTSKLRGTMGAKSLFTGGSNGERLKIRTPMNVVSFRATATRVK